jgi:hypothetical protein
MGKIQKAASGKTMNLFEMYWNELWRELESGDMTSDVISKKWKS